MGSLFLEIGQCGCQIGNSLNPQLATSYYCTRSRPPHRLHLMMVDTEPKVLQPLLLKSPKWLDPLNVKYFQHGRGNNWSYGYMHALPEKKPSPQLLSKHQQFSHTAPNAATLEKYTSENKAICEYVLDRMRHELENVDCAMCVNVIGSLGGGTGSGLGAKMIERISEEFGLDVYSHLVLPNKAGQTPLQVYNCLLSLSVIQQHSAAIFTYENNKMLSLLQKREQPGGSLDDINALLASSIAKLVRVNDLPGYDRFYTDIASACVLSPELKYLNLFGTESRKGSWDDTFSQLFGQVKNYLSDDYAEQFTENKAHRQKLFHGELLLVGREEIDYEKSYAKKFKQVVNPLFEDSLNVETFKSKGTHTNSLLGEQKEQKGGKEDERCEAIYIANHSAVVQYLDYLLSSGTNKFEVGAYLWHYEYADVEEALDRMQNVVEQYNCVSSERYR